MAVQEAEFVRDLLCDILGWRGYVCARMCVSVCVGVGNPLLQIAVLQDQPQRVQLDMYGQLSLGSLTAPSVWSLRELSAVTVLLASLQGAWSGAALLR